MEHAGKEEATFLRDEELKACFSKKEILAYLARTFSESFRGMGQKEVESCLIGRGTGRAPQ